MGFCGDAGLVLGEWACASSYIWSSSFSKISDRRSDILDGNENDTSDLIDMDQIYVTLRDERREAAIVAVEKKRTEEDRL